MEKTSWQPVSQQLGLLCPHSPSFQLDICTTHRVHKTVMFSHECFSYSVPLQIQWFLLPLVSSQCLFPWLQMVHSAALFFFVILGSFRLSARISGMGVSLSSFLCELASEPRWPALWLFLQKQVLLSANPSTREVFLFLKPAPDTTHLHFGYPWPRQRL